MEQEMIKRKNLKVKKLDCQNCNIMIQFLKNNEE